MPKSGFKSITVHDKTYDTYFAIYLKQKDELAMRGINSFSGWITEQLSKLIEQEKKK